MRLRLYELTSGDKAECWPCLTKELGIDQLLHEMSETDKVQRKNPISLGVKHLEN